VRRCVCGGVCVRGVQAYVRVYTPYVMHIYTIVVCHVRKYPCLCTAFFGTSKCRIYVCLSVEKINVLWAGQILIS